MMAFPRQRGAGESYGAGKLDDMMGNTGTSECLGQSIHEDALRGWAKVRERGALSYYCWLRLKRANWQYLAKVKVHTPFDPAITHQ